MDFTQKKIGFFTYSGNNKVTMPTDRDTWSGCAVVKDSLWSMVTELSLGAAALFKSVEGDEEDVYKNLVRGRL